MENKNKKIKLDHNDDNNNNKELNNVLIIKILKYLFDESIKNQNYYSFYCKLSLICKSWSLFIVPKLGFEEILFKNDDLLYTYLKVRDTIKQVTNSKEKSSYIICCDYPNINQSLTFLHSPTVTTGIYEINSQPPQPQNNNYWGPQINNDFNIYIDGEKCGTIFKPDIYLIEKLSKPSSFGQADKTVYDESIRKGFHIEGSRVEVPFFDYTVEFDRNLNTKDQYLKNSYSFNLKLYKIHIYKEGGHFEDHIDTIHSMDHVGTYIVPLGVNTYEGGEFVISENETFDHTTQTYRIEALPNKDDVNVFNFKWIAFYNDCIHKVVPVTKGTRIVLQFNIYTKPLPTWIRNDDFISVENNLPRMHEGSVYHYQEQIKYSVKNQYLTYNLPNDIIEQSVSINKKIINQITSEFDKIMKTKNVNIGLFLVHLYKAHVNQENLKGVDKLIWQQLKEHYGEKRIKIQTFLITRTVDISYNDDDNEDGGEDNPNLKISLISPKSINEPSSIVEPRFKFKNTLMFCGYKYSNLISIYTKPLPSTGNEERGYEDLGCFSAIIINE